MLNGVSPILIFTFPVELNSPVFNVLAGIPVIGESLAANIGVPIPIYLDRNLAGVVVDSETKALDIETKTEAKTQAGTPDVSQRGLGNVVTINMSGNRDSLILAAVAALCDLAFQKIVSKSYSVTYINGPTVIINGLIEAFSSSVSSNNDLLNLTLQISKSNQKIKTEPAVSFGSSIQGAVPL